MVFEMEVSLVIGIIEVAKFKNMILIILLKCLTFFHQGNEGAKKSTKL